MCLVVRSRMASQSETKSHISYCVIAKSRSMLLYTWPWAHMNISPSLHHSHTHLCSATFVVNITHQHDRTLQAIHCYACYLVGLLVITQQPHETGQRAAGWPPLRVQSF